MGMGVNRYLRLFLMLALIGLPCSLMAENALIKVASQEQFDAAVARINSGEETHIVLKNGTVDRQGPKDVILPTLMNYSEMTPGCGKADVEGDGKSC